MSVKVRNACIQFLAGLCKDQDVIRVTEVRSADLFEIAVHGKKIHVGEKRRDRSTGHRTARRKRDSTIGKSAFATKENNRKKVKKVRIVRDDFL